MGDNSSKPINQCPQCKSVFSPSESASLPSDTICNACADENRKKELSLPVHCKHCSKIFFAPAAFPKPHSTSIHCDECADSMREMLKSGQYMKYHGSISDERHCNIIFPKEGLEAVLKEIENSGIVPKIED